MLNVCSAAAGPADPAVSSRGDPVVSSRGDPDVSSRGDGAGSAGDARARILSAAVELVGRDGARSATVREVAGAAGVSPALVMHHFGSKAGLLAACDDEVMHAIQQAIAALSATDREAGLAELLAAESASPAVSYVGRVLHDGGEAGTRWFEWMIGLTERGMSEMSEAGLARPAGDPKMQAVLLLAMDVGIVLLRSHVERYLGAAITDPEITRRWAAAELDLLTNGVLTTPTANPRRADVADHRTEPT